MAFKKYKIPIISILLLSVLLSNCSKKECTKMINVPRFDSTQGAFINNFIEVSCDFDEPVDAITASILKNN